MADIELEAIAESIGTRQLNEGNPFKHFENKLNDRSNVHEFVILTSMNPGRPDDVAMGEDREAPLEALKTLPARKVLLAPEKSIIEGYVSSSVVPL